MAVSTVLGNGNKSYTIQVVTRIEIHHRFFYGDNFTSKNFKKLFMMESLFNITQDGSLQLNTLLRERSTVT